MCLAVLQEVSGRVLPRAVAIRMVENGCGGLQVDSGFFPDISKPSLVSLLPYLVAKLLVRIG